MPDLPGKLYQCYRGRIPGAALRLGSASRILSEAEIHHRPLRDRLKGEVMTGRRADHRAKPRWSRDAGIASQSFSNVSPLISHDTPNATSMIVSRTRDICAGTNFDSSVMHNASKTRQKKIMKPHQK